MRPTIADSTAPTDDGVGQFVELVSHGRLVIYDRTNHTNRVASDDPVDLREVR